MLSLKTKISQINKLSKEHFLAFKKLKIETLQDLLFYFPNRYSDTGTDSSVASIKKGEKVCLYGEIFNLEIGKSFKGNIPMCSAKFLDTTGSIKLIWLHQAYLAKIYKDGDFVKIEGTISEKENKFAILNPKINKIDRNQIFKSGNLFQELNLKQDNKNNPNLKNISQNLIEIHPVYKEVKGLSSNYLNTLYKKIFQDKNILAELKKIEVLPENILQDLHLPNLEKALLYIHLPKGKNQEEINNQILSAEKRFSFEEIFLIQIIKNLEKIKAKNFLSYKIQNQENTLKEVLDFVKKDLKINLTGAQDRVLKDISKNLSFNDPMGRLLEGDVGSGKTLVAEMLSYIITDEKNKDQENKKRLQVAIMAPTEILATQHFESFLNFFKNKDREIGLLTSKICKKYPSKVNPNSFTKLSKSQLKKEIENGSISIIVGTHALISKTLNFKNLALVIIDEQHRFGVKQRAALASKKSNDVKILAANDINNLTNKVQKIINTKNKLPHLLSMTATPIPRTLALTIFGDLDLSILDELPKNRKKIETKIVVEKDREEIYKEIEKEIHQGYQVYIVVPKIEELTDEEKQNIKKLDLRSVESEVKNLEDFFNKKFKNNFKIVGISGKNKKEEKEKIMTDFSENKINILVATSIVEVGVNVPNASRMIIEGAERFGLAQLHQLRGRIGRGERESLCYLFNNSFTDKTQNRLSAILKAKNGFELAEYDMNQRGVGSLLNGKQWGVTDLGMEAIKNLKLVEIARNEAQKILEKDPELKNFSNLKNKILEIEKIHLE